MEQIGFCVGAQYGADAEVAWSLHGTFAPKVVLEVHSYISLYMLPVSLGH